MGQGNTGTTLIIAGSDLTATGTITAQNLNPYTGTPTAGSYVEVAINNNQTTGVQVTGTYTGDLNVQGTIDGSNWINISVIPRSALNSSQHQTGIYSASTGIFNVTSASFVKIRVTALSAVTGTATVTLLATQSTARVFTDETLKHTYFAAFNGVLPATNATDFLTITGSTSKTIRVLEMEFSGNKTAAQVIDVLLIKRSTANSGGTSTTLTAVPTDSTSPAATATLRVYTANPTLGTSLGTMLTDKYLINTIASLPDNFEAEFYQINDTIRPTLRGINETLSLNFNGVLTNAGGTFDGYIIWTEE